MSSKPIVVLISDIHFSLSTLEVATAAFIKAQQKAYQLSVPLVVTGDTLDTKAVMRAECVNRLITLLEPKDAPETIFLVGNHDLCNERSKEHSLNFLKKYAVVVDQVQDGDLSGVNIRMIPYQSNPKTFLEALQPDVINLAHQGITSAHAGHYMQDHSAVSKEDLTGYRIISGHYHYRQDIQLTDGLWSFVGNPFTLNFGEAKDPDKGFQVLHDDGNLEFISTGLRRHRVIEVTPETLSPLQIPEQDILWVKLSGYTDALSKLDKAAVAKALNLSQDFRLDKIPTDRTSAPQSVSLRNEDLLNYVIGCLDSTDERKHRLKTLWRGL